MYDIQPTQTFPPRYHYLTVKKLHNTISNSVTLTLSEIVIANKYFHA